MRSLQFELQTSSANVRPDPVPAPLVKVCSASGVNANNCGAARPIVLRAHKGAREQALPFQTYARPRQLLIRRRPVIAQQLEQGRRVGQVPQRRLQSSLGVLNL